jgi:phosphopantetheine adenylyltransferase
MSAVPTFDADATALKTRILLPSMNLETTTERRVRECVRDALREEFGDDEAEVDAAIVSREIDAFLKTINASRSARGTRMNQCRRRC